MGDSTVPPEWGTQVENLAHRFSVSRTVALQAMQQSSGHAGKAARKLRLSAPQPIEQLTPLVDLSGSTEQDPPTPPLELEPRPGPEPEQEPTKPPSVEPVISSRNSPVHKAMADTLTALEAATHELRALTQECHAEESDGTVTRGISLLGKLEAVVQTHRARLASMQGAIQEDIALALPTFSELWSALSELKELYAQAPDQEDFFMHSMREIWVSIDELVSDDGCQEETSGDWRHANPHLLLATAQGLQSQELWSAAIVVYSRLLDLSDTEIALQPNRQLYYNGRGMCHAKLGDMAAAACDIDTAGALVASAALHL